MNFFKVVLINIIYLLFCGSLLAEEEFLVAKPLPAGKELQGNVNMTILCDQYKLFSIEGGKDRFIRLANDQTLLTIMNGPDGPHDFFYYFNKEERRCAFGYARPPAD